MNFSNRNAIVTGGANGIGRCIVEHFVRAGINKVLVIDTDERACSDLKKLYPDNLEFICGDIADRNVIEDYVNAQVFVPVDIVINNACTSRKGILSDCSWDDFDYVQRVGVTAPYYLVSQLFKAGLLAKGASIINIASTRSFQSQADTESYSAAKGGILALTHALSVSLAGQARVNAISPGWIDTSAYHSKGVSYTQSKEDEAQHSAGRVGRPEDVAEIVLFLCDNERAGFITGENIIIDGGMSKLMVYHNDKGWSYKA